MPWLFIDGESKINNAAMQTTEPQAGEGSLHTAQLSAPAENGDGLEVAMKTEAQQVESSLMQPPLPEEEPGPTPGTVGPAWQPAPPHEEPPVYGPVPEGAAGILQIKQVCTVPCPVSLLPALSHARQA